jgi:hypothetical protein
MAAFVFKPRRWTNRTSARRSGDGALSVFEADVGELADLVDSKTHRDEYCITMLDPGGASSTSSEPEPPLLAAGWP